MKDEIKIKQIEEFVINNNLTDATNELKKIFEDADENSLYNETLLILSRINNFSRKSDQGIIDYFDPEFGKIRLAVINLISSAKAILKSKENSVEQKNSSKNEYIKTTLIKEYFVDNKNNWPIIAEELQKSYIKNRRYYIKNLRNDTALSFTITKIIDIEKSFKIKGRLTFLEGHETNTFGLIWGSGEAGNFNRFAISANGRYIVDHAIEGQVINITPWTENQSIKIGQKANSLEIIKNEEVLHFKINDEVVFIGEFLPFFGDNIGFVVDSNIEVVADSFQIIN